MRQDTIIAIGLLLAGVAAVIYFTTREQPFVNESFEQKYKDEIRVSDSLKAEIARMEIITDSLKKKANRSDSVRQVFVDSLRDKFNDDEKAKLVRTVSDLDDTASFEFFSKWLSEGRNN